MTTIRGTTEQGWGFLDMVRDTIATHGLAWAVRYYAARMPQWELRFWMRLAIA